MSKKHIPVRYFVTGGAGFIGSHLVNRLVNTGTVTIYDNLSVGKQAFIETYLNSGKATLIKADLLDFTRLVESIEGHEVVFHLAADSDVFRDYERTKTHFDQEIIATFNLLEAMRRSNIKKLVFTSSSVVYGEATRFPIPEDYGPLLPISLYGAGKLADEGLISSYCHIFGMQTWICRNANIVGNHGTHGVIYDFLHKLLLNPYELEIRGDGTQQKSYVHVDEFIDAMLYIFNHAKDQVNLYNIGCNSSSRVNDIARMVIQEMGNGKTSLKYTGGKRGWPGDVPHFELDVSKLEKLGWAALLSSNQAVKKAIPQLKEEILSRKEAFD